MTYDQAEFDVRCEWGLEGVAQLAGVSDAIVIVDVLSFSTCVSIAVSRGAKIVPCRWKDAAAADFARSAQAELAAPRGQGRYSLSPQSLRQIPVGTRLVLPSPNGSTLTLSTGRTPTFAGCLRNARAVATAAMACGRRIAVVPAGERWQEGGTLRPALEDLIGAGAIIRHLAGNLSPEARLAADAFRGAEGRLLETLAACSSGKELREKGFEEDVVLSAELENDASAPFLKEGAYQPW